MPALVVKASREPVTTVRVRRLMVFIFINFLLRAFVLLFWVKFAADINAAYSTADATNG